MTRTLSIVVPCFNEQEVLPEFHHELSHVLDQLEGIQSDVLYVDDGSEDRTLNVLGSLADNDARIRIASLSRNFGHQTALTAGLDLVDTDAVITMDCDLQHPPKLIPQLIQKWNEGHDVVSTIRRETENIGWLKRLTSDTFYRLMNRMSDTEIVSRAADFGLFSRRAYTELRRLPERHRFIRGLVGWLGLPRAFVPFDAPQRAAGESKYSLRKMLRLAGDAVLSFSSLPLRIASVVGACVTVLGASYLGYVLSRQLLLRDLIPGWGSLIATLLILGGVQLICLGVASEYIARIYEQVKGRPHYVLKLDPRVSEQSASTRRLEAMEEQIEELSRVVEGLK